MPEDVVKPAAGAILGRAPRWRLQAILRPKTDGKELTAARPKAVQAAISVTLARKTDIEAPPPGY
jgi:hypothetical protein